MAVNYKRGVKWVKLGLIGLVTGIANGLLGSGGGTIVVPAMTQLLGVEEHKAHATAISIILPLTLLSAFVYMNNGYNDWQLTWKVTTGGLLGGFIGAKLLTRCPVTILRKVFGVFMLLSALRMLV